jgi:hypothetical protein
MVISPRPPDIPEAVFIAGDWISRFEARSLDDIRKIGRNSQEEDRALAAVARVSALNLTAYRRFVQPWVRAVASQPMADMAKALNPLRLSYTIFADRNPLMKNVEKMAKAVTAARKPVAPDNPFLAQQTWFSGQITAGLQSYRKSRDRMKEKLFFGIYSSPLVQAMVGLDSHSEVRPLPTIPPATLAAQETRLAAGKASLRTGGFDEALVRAVLFITLDDRVFDQRSAVALNVMRQQFMHLSLAPFKTMVRQQTFVLHLECENALLALASMVPEKDKRIALIKQAEAIISAGGAMTLEESRRLVRLSQILAVLYDKLPATEASSRTLPMAGNADAGTVPDHADV